MSEINKYGIGFWAGDGVYSLINPIMNYSRAPQSNLLLYNHIILGAAIIGIAPNIILLKRAKKNP